MRSLSVQTLAVMLVGLNIVAAGALATIAYRAAREGLVRQAVVTARIVADGREQALTRLLDRQHGRLRAFIDSVERLCGERATMRAVDFERECVNVALRGFRASERAVAAALMNGERRVAVTGPIPRDTPFPEPESGLARVLTRDDGTVYTMQARRGHLAVRVIYPIVDLENVFRDRSGLRTQGRIVLTDASGRVLIPVDAPADVLRPPAAATALRHCLSGESGDVLVEDGAADRVIAGFQPAPAIGYGCVLARLDYDEALVPIYRLGRFMLFSAGALVVLAALISFLIARMMTRPIARLAAAAGDLEAGRFDRKVPVGGPVEIRRLGRALSRMARSIGDLVQREQDARLEAEQANRTKDDFLATLSHELRTPLTSILGWVSILQTSRDPHRIDHALRVIERSARAEARLIDDLLDVTRIVNGQLRLRIADTSVITAVEAAFESVRPAAELKGVLLAKHVEGSPSNVSADPHRLQQVVWNLLANAVRFTPQGGRVDVTIRQLGAGTELRVSDTGAGITPDLLPHVFERFRQGDTGSKRATSGLGLGLAIVRHIVELHGGAVRADSDGEGRGATFTVTLPPAPVRDVPAAVPPPPALADVDLTGTCVIVVDDDEDAREVVREILEDAGATVATSASASESRALIERMHPHVLIADIVMPVEDGYSLIRSLRSRGNHVARLPAIALTAHAREEDVERALESGFQVHVAKPVERSRLLTTVATLAHPAA